MIIQNAVTCLACGDFIVSKHRHDFVTCTCGAVSVDGGQSYLRRVGDFTMQNDALSYCLHCMASSDGFATTVRYYDHKMVQHKYDVQLSVVHKG